MSLVVTSLNAATATGAGAAANFETPKTDVSMQVAITGSPATVNVNFEVSIDGVNWQTVDSISVNKISTLKASGSSAADGPIVAARANLTALSGGTSPTVTATIASTVD